MLEQFVYSVDGKDYQVNVVRKRIKNIHFRFRDGAFYISCNRLVSKRSMVDGLDKFAKKMINRSLKESRNNENFLYIFGESYEKKYPINISFYEITEENAEKILRKILLEYLSEKVPEFASKMGITEVYKIKVKNTKTRLGSNSRATKTLGFSLQLVRFSYEIIDSVIVHELAHCLVFDHSDRFYNVVYQHCPNYNILRKKLIHSEYK